MLSQRLFCDAFVMRAYRNNKTSMHDEKKDAKDSPQNLDKQQKAIIATDKVIARFQSAEHVNEGGVLIKTHFLFYYRNMLVQLVKSRKENLYAHGKDTKHTGSTKDGLGNPETHEQEAESCKNTIVRSLIADTSVADREYLEASGSASKTEILVALRLANLECCRLLAKETQPEHTLQEMNSALDALNKLDKSSLNTRAKEVVTQETTRTTKEITTAISNLRYG